MKSKSNRVCLAAGYKYEFDGVGRNWASSSDESWDTVMTKTLCGQPLGRRHIDGALTRVVLVRGKAYASQHVIGAKGVQMAGPRRRRR